MAFVDLARSVYQGQHSTLSRVEEGKVGRRLRQAKDRRSKRVDTFTANRDIQEGDEDLPLTPQIEVGPVPNKDKEVLTDPRKRQMLQWKEERMKKKKLEPKKLPPFKTGVVRHPVAPQQEEIYRTQSKNSIKTRLTVQSVPRRLTRAAAKLNNYNDIPVAATPFRIHQKSFAPPDAKFRAPTLAINDKKLKYTPMKTRKATAPTIKLTNVLKNIQSSKSTSTKPFDFNVNTKKTRSATEKVVRPVRSRKRLSKEIAVKTRGAKANERKGNRLSGVSKQKRLSGISKHKRLSGVSKGKQVNNAKEKRLSGVTKEKRLSNASKAKRISNAEIEKILEEYPGIVKDKRSTGKRRSSRRSGANREVETVDNGSKIEIQMPSSLETSLNKTGSSVEGQNRSEDLVITSPFVTVARGKTNQRRETMYKIKLGYAEMSPEKEAQYFRLQLDGEIRRLRALCYKWNTYQTENRAALTEDADDQINLAVGQTQLLMNKKLQQFRGLVVACENNEEREGERILPQDLQGFWDMVYIQVVNVDTRFKKLEEMKQKDWKEDDVVMKAQTKKKVSGKAVKSSKPNSKFSSGLKAMIQAARMKTKTAESTLPAVMTTLKPETVTFNGGFFSVVSPVKTTTEEQVTKSSSKRTSLLKTVVDSEAKKRLSAKTPDSAKTIIRVSRRAKTVNNPELILAPIDLKKTPAKSILKTPAKDAIPQSCRKSLKVLFSSDLSEEYDSCIEDIDIVKRSSSGGDWTVMSQQKPELNYIEEDLKLINMALPEVLPKKRGKLSRQKRVCDDGEDTENMPPVSSIKTRRKSIEDTPKKIYNTRRRKSHNDNLLEISLGSMEEIIHPVKSRRSKRKSINEGVITYDRKSKLGSMPSESTPVVVKRKKSQSLDDRQSLNFISFSPNKPVPNTRYLLRRVSTNS